MSYIIFAMLMTLLVMFSFFMLLLLGILYHHETIQAIEQHQHKKALLKGINSILFYAMSFLLLYVLS